VTSQPYVIDTWAWVEYFRGSEVGRRAKDHIEKCVNFTPTIVLAEMKRKFVEWGRSDFEEKLEFMRRHSTLIPLDESAATLAGEIRANPPVKGMGIVDCILLAASRLYGAKIVTGDPHFRMLTQVDYIGD
jgi:predicted nucleic acid-binding protein